MICLTELNADNKVREAAVTLAGLFFEVTRIQAHIEERERKSKGVETDITASGSQWVCLDKMRVHSLNLYAPTLLPCAGSTLNSFRRFSNIVFR